MAVESVFYDRPITACEKVTHINDFQEAPVLNASLCKNTFQGVLVVFNDESICRITKRMDCTAYEMNSSSHLTTSAATQSFHQRLNPQSLCARGNDYIIIIRFFNEAKFPSSSSFFLFGLHQKVDRETQTLSC